MNSIWSKVLILGAVIVGAEMTTAQEPGRFVIDASKASWRNTQNQDIEPLGTYNQDGNGTQESDPDVLRKINPLRKPMSQLSLDIREVAQEAPMDQSQEFTNLRPNLWTAFAPSPIGYAWTAPDIQYQPLYFENVPLERYGQTRGPWREVGASGIHFYRSLSLMPYHGRFDHYRSCDYPLGFCRPGNAVAPVRQLQWWGF